MESFIILTSVTMPPGLSQWISQRMSATEPESKESQPRLKHTGLKQKPLWPPSEGSEARLHRERGGGVECCDKAGRESELSQ